MTRFQITILAAVLSLAACATTPRWPAIPAMRETEAVSATGDAADDPAIWVAPDAAQSLVIATQKQGGLYLFDLAGQIVQEAPGGRPNNVDLRDAFAWPEGAAPIVGASDRSDNAIVLWRFDPMTRRLNTTARARIPTGFSEIYGFCLGRLADGFVAIATDKGGEVGVWRLSVSAGGAVSSERTAAFNLGSIAEGCVVDDETGEYYVAQELVGIWRIAPGDSAGAARRLIDRVGAGGNLVADVEGLSIWRGEDRGGYLVASVQGRSRFAVYDRGDNAYRGSFGIGVSHDLAADAVSGTDGIDISSAPLGPEYPRGLMVAQDDENTGPAALQNFKYVSWAEIATALGLE